MTFAIYGNKFRKNELHFLKNLKKEKWKKS